MLTALCSLLGCRSLPPGFNVAGPEVPVGPDDVRLLIDTTAWNVEREARVIRQEIFDGLLAMIGSAHSSIVLDLFLWNRMGTGPEVHRPLSRELVDALLQRLEERPSLEILVLTDPINALYGTSWDPELLRLREAGIPVVLTDLDRLRDSHTLYAPPARSAAWLLDRTPHPEGYLSAPRLDNPFDPKAPKLSYQQVGRLLYFKANHRKVAVVDGADGVWTVLVTSFNPHDASSAHSNIALQLRGAVARQALASELDCIAWSARAIENEGERLEVEQAVRAVRRAAGPASPLPDATGATARWVSERAIRDSIIALCDEALPGSDIRIAMFYLSERHVIRAIRRAAKRGVTVQLILDLNRDAFGRKKNGVPNRIVARELMGYARRHSLNLEVRWADTHGEQFHTKAICVTDRDAATSALMCGSANWTRRNLNNLNMEACALVRGDATVVERFCDSFDRAWENSGGLRYTLPYADFAEGWWSAFWKGGLYRFGEHMGSSTF
ncbi:MAG: phospholipase [Verrucomicrobia bacterium]|jgi:phosphatidylserine/phosphatidylglycerophosphate/cardiolipin synthase-like enzyme|nr:phospholipase [Verrucomicrobiota bacterium]MBT7068212.1 phospholipase [Verrucomicrobiota bacterium]MBT7699041.1 phospholipase [Verrucomicrobiota bacterium]